MKIARIQITSIFIFRWQIFDKIFSNYYLLQHIISRIRTFHTGYHIYLAEERTSHPEDNHDLSFPIHDQTEQSTIH